MARPQLRLRLLDRLTHMSFAEMDENAIARAQREVPRDFLVDQLIGKAAAGVNVTDGTADGAEAAVRVRIYRPAIADRALPLVLNFHGGGFVVGSIEQSDWLCSNVAKDVGAVVVSVKYRTAPAHRWPAAADDCYAALVDVVERAAELGADPLRVSVMGESAGGNLAAVIALMARDRNGPALANQILIYPLTDLTLTSPSLEENAEALILNKRDVVGCRDHYLGGQDPADPYASPLSAPDLRGLPPALIQVAQHDPIRDDGMRYANALRAAGVCVRTTCYVGMPHGYLAFPKFCRSAAQALAEICATLGGAW
jgi:acetyl esterase/lipase